MSGISYYAMNQYQVAALQPPNLCAICAWEGAGDHYRDATYHGGIFSEFMTNWYPRAALTMQHGVGSRGMRSRSRHSGASCVRSSSPHSILPGFGRGFFTAPLGPAARARVRSWLRRLEQRRGPCSMAPARARAAKSLAAASITARPRSGAGPRVAGHSIDLLAGELQPGDGSSGVGIAPIAGAGGASMAACLVLCRRRQLAGESNYRELAGIAGYGFF